MSQLITDATGILLEYMADEYGEDIDFLYKEFEGILADPETKNLGLTKIQTNEYALHMLRVECMQR